MSQRQRMPLQGVLQSEASVLGNQERELQGAGEKGKNDLKEKVAIVVVSIARCKPIARKTPWPKSAKL